MTRQKKRKSLAADILALPWQVQLVLACVAMAISALLPDMTRSAVLLPLTKVVAHIAWLCAMGLAALAAFNYGMKRYREQDRNRFALAPQDAAGLERTEPHPDAGDTAASTETSIEIEYISPAPSAEASPKPESWSLELLQALEWKRFETVCVAYYTQRGFRVETIACGADGGIDAKLYFGRIKDPVAIVRCKAWGGRPVGAQPVRELLGVMARHDVAKGIFHATGRFSDDAVAFAQSSRIQLMDGADFVKRIVTLPEAARQALLRTAIEGDYKTPTCPSCDIKMMKREGERGAFWGCINYPDCRVVLDMS